ncbi:MAG: alpha/beta hydrolase [Dehalococcoidia bacterium]|nr:alpha/beta hydrolase [Dehalococcoidia bacterium]
MIFDGSPAAPLVLLLAHGVGAPMDSPFMEAFARGIAGPGVQVARFEFPYMALRRVTDARRPPDRETVLLSAWREAAAAFAARPLALGGKSLGGRMASMVADELHVLALVCMGYPFHPPGRPDRPRTAHLETIRTPTLVLQGTRDPFGRKDEVEAYRLSPAIRLHWLADGDHDFRPPAASGRTREENWREGVAAVRAFLAGLSDPLSGAQNPED